MEYSLVEVEEIMMVIDNKEKERKLRIKKLVKYMNKMNMDVYERKEYRKMLEKFGEI